MYENEYILESGLAVVQKNKTRPGHILVLSIGIVIAWKTWWLSGRAVVSYLGSRGFETIVCVRW